MSRCRGRGCRTLSSPMRQTQSDWLIDRPADRQIIAVLFWEQDSFISQSYFLTLSIKTLRYHSNIPCLCLDMFCLCSNGCTWQTRNNFQKCIQWHVALLRAIELITVNKEWLDPLRHFQNVTNEIHRDQLKYSRERQNALCCLLVLFACKKVF